MKELNSVMKYYKDQLENATTKQEYDSATAGIAATQAKIDAQPMALKLGIDEESMAEVLDQINSLGDEVQPIKIEATGIESVAKDATAAAKAFNMATSSVSQLGSALSGLEDPSAKAAGIVLTSIASIAQGFGSAVAQAGSMGPWAWLAFTAAGLGALATTISMVHSLTNLSEGGIVQGNTYSNDQIYAGGAMVNAGELVLNRSQQGVLAAQLTQNEGGGGSSLPYVNGEQIYLGLNNYLRRTGRGELITAH